MEEETIGEQIIEAIEEDVKQMPHFFKSGDCEFQDRHTAMQTYLMFRMLQEIEGIHNGFFVLYNEKQSGQKQHIPNPGPNPEPALPPMPDPTPEQIEDPTFLAIWNVIKSWDVNVPEHYVGYCGATGSHVMLIWNALKAIE